jgi:hypothetical protein
MCKAKSMSRAKPILRMAFCGADKGLAEGGAWGALKALGAGGAESLADMPPFCLA